MSDNQSGWKVKFYMVYHDFSEREEHQLVYTPSFPSSSAIPERESYVVLPAGYSDIQMELKVQELALNYATQTVTILVDETYETDYGGLSLELFKHPD